MSGATLPVTHEVDGEEITTNLPARWEICEDCSGTGGSSAYLGAFTSDEWRQQDEDFQQDYMAGRLDRPCTHCRGSGKVLVVNVAQCRTLALRRALRWMRSQARSDAEERATQRAESRLMGDY